jgi:acetylornithine deacetylase/succinyl-diaminopimelate desuccinylase family protein
MSELAELLSELVAIDSVNPELVRGAGGEGEVARFVAEWLERAGLEVEVAEAAPGRPNVVGTARGAGGGRSLLLNAHTDTVGVAGMEAPFSPRVEDGRLFGRGAYDMKAGLAAALLAARDARARKLRGDVIVAAVVDEEVGSIGTEALVRTQRADAAIVTEPTGLRIGIAHKGFIAFELTTEGHAAHGSRPDLGVDAIAKMGRVLVGLEALDRALRANPTHPLLGSGSLHAGVISGGQEYSSYPASCTVHAERRTVPGETVELVDGELATLLDRLAEEDADLRASWRRVFAREPFEIDPDDPFVELVRRAAGADLVGEWFWTDAALLAAAGIPTVLYGPGGEGAHAEVEWVDLASAERCREVLVRVAENFCS